MKKVYDVLIIKKKKFRITFVVIVIKEEIKFRIIFCLRKFFIVFLIRIDQFPNPNKYKMMSFYLYGS